MKIYNDIAYLNDSKLQRLDIYTPNKSNHPSTVLIYIHGGTWSYGDKLSSQKHGEFYQKNGFIFVSINYRLYSPKIQNSKHPTQAEDCAAAISWVFNNIEQYGGDKNNIYISGHSSGAHLASLISTDEKYLKKHHIKPSDIKGVVAIDTSAFNLNSYDYVDYSANKQMLEMKDLVHEVFSGDKNDLLEASPIKYADQETCERFLIIVSSQRPLAVKVSSNFVKRINKYGKSASLFIANELDHEQINSAMYANKNMVSSKILQFLNSQLENKELITEHGFSSY